MKDEGSVASSANSTTRNIDKYNYFEEFIRASNVPLSIRMIGWIRMMEYALLLLTMIIVMMVVYNSFNTLAESIKLIEFSSAVTFDYFNILSFTNNFIANNYQPAATLSAQFDLLSSRIDALRVNLTNHYSQLYIDDRLTKYFINDEVYIQQPY